MPLYRWTIAWHLVHGTEQIITAQAGVTEFLASERFTVTDNLGVIHVFTWRLVKSVAIERLQEEASGATHQG